ncbi:YxbD [Bacillus paralicheniformis]|nr:YxbD [Bacillus paralicheniformis]
MTDDKGDIKGLITYFIAGNECEVVSLDSIAENKGIGSLLLNEVERAAKRILPIHRSGMFRVN